MTVLGRSLDLESHSLYSYIPLIPADISLYPLLLLLQYLLRDILQFDESLQKAMDRISSAHRTCDLILGVGDGKVTRASTAESAL